MNSYSDILRMINDDEYHQMVGGTADDVFDVLLTPPRAGEVLTLSAGHWHILYFALVSIDPTPREIMKSLRWNTEEMAGFNGHIIRYGVVREQVPVFSAISSDLLRTALTRCPNPDEIAASYESLRDFMTVASSLIRSVHVVNEVFLQPSNYPHRARQRRSRQLKKERKMNQRDASKQ